MWFVSGTLPKSQGMELESNNQERGWEVGSCLKRCLKGLFKKKAKKNHCFPVHFCLKCNKGRKVEFSYHFQVYKAPSQLFFTATLKDEDSEV